MNGRRERPASIPGHFRGSLHQSRQSPGQLREPQFRVDANERVPAPNSPPLANIAGKKGKLQRACSKEHLPVLQASMQGLACLERRTALNTSDGDAANSLGD